MILFKKLLIHPRSLFLSANVVRNGVAPLVRGSVLWKIGNGVDFPHWVRAQEHVSFMKGDSAVRQLFSSLFPHFWFLFISRLESFHSSWSVSDTVSFFSNIWNSFPFFSPNLHWSPSHRDPIQNYVSFTIFQHFAFMLQIIFLFALASPNLWLGLQVCVYF